jgi:two-component system, cell cycle sensor histidine kinase PleC
MLNAAFGSSKSNSLMNEYASLLGEAVLRKRARSAEDSARIEAELASKIKSEFIGNMSHELRTPLNTVIGFAKLLSEHDRRQLSNQEIVEYANLITDAAGHLLSVINDVLDISKMQSGRYTIDNREIDLDEVVTTALPKLRSMADDAKVTLASTVAVGLPKVRGDARKLNQALNNLISNAIKFTPAGGRVSIEVLRQVSGGVSIMISDSGVGMTPQELDIALMPFGQVDGSRTRWREGTGLGLPIAKALIELHGGTIDIQSAKGKGTQIAITLPSLTDVSMSTGTTGLDAYSTLD